jgi:hypothetical protein
MDIPNNNFMVDNRVFVSKYSKSYIDNKDNFQTTSNFKLIFCPVTRDIFAIANQAHLHRKRMQKSFISTAQQICVLTAQFCASPSSQSKAQACGSKA